MPEAAPQAPPVKTVFFVRRREYSIARARPLPRRVKWSIHEGEIPRRKAKHHAEGAPLVVMANETKRKSSAGEVTLGAGVRMARTVEVGLAMRAAGFDWLFIDMEHGPFDLETAQQISIAALS